MYIRSLQASDVHRPVLHCVSSTFVTRVLCYIRSWALTNWAQNCALTPWSINDFSTMRSEMCSCGVRAASPQQFPPENGERARTSASLAHQRHVRVYVPRCSLGACPWSPQEFCLRNKTAACWLLRHTDCVCLPQRKGIRSCVSPCGPCTRPSFRGLEELLALDRVVLAVPFAGHSRHVRPHLLFKRAT